MSTLNRSFATEDPRGVAAWQDDHLRWWLAWYGALWGDRTEVESSIRSALPARPGESWPMVLTRGRNERGQQ